VVDGARGHILTNAHVVNGATAMRVTFTDGRTFEARLLGSDDVTDLALLAVVPPRSPAGAAAEDVADAIAALALPQAPLGDSRCLDVGDWVVAVGNPVGLDSSVTLGIVSALRRSAAEVGIPDKRLDFIQTDAAINPGNSGGPLVNEFGEVVGISTAIRADAEGIGFAIPINTAKGVAAALAEGRPVQHPYLGIQARFMLLLL
jgi:S1-C subfamily serine protease